MRRIGSSGGRYTSVPGLTGQRSSYIFSLLTAIVLTVVGFISTLPFAWFAIVVGDQAVISDARVFAIIMVVIGLPLFVTGLIGIIARKHHVGYSSLESDVSRIRFAAETHMMSDAMKSMKGE